MLIRGLMGYIRPCSLIKHLFGVILSYLWLGASAKAFGGSYGTVFSNLEQNLQEIATTWELS